MNEQQSDAWRQDRAGRITASCFASVMAFTEGGGEYKSGPRKGQPKLPTSSSERNKYMRELAFERLAEKPKHNVSSKSLAWGTELEAFAREAYEEETGLIVARSEFIVHPEFPFIGGSPDGLVGNDGGVEIKCPMDEAVHVETWLSGMPEDHMAQLQGNLFVTGRKWWDFISYDPRTAERFRIYIQRIPRDEIYIERLKNALLVFESELSELIKTLESKLRVV